ncbi:MAG: hypothetical protein KY464_02005 [Gemmatimonadetes bacterium]|nr:hypothetical protein [Gemmatimonadota bacterium]
MDALRALGTRWRDLAAELRAHGCEPAAVAYDRAAAELDGELRAARSEALTPTEAARESGYSERRLRELEQQGRLQNVGRKGAPRYLRRELPRKAKRSTDGTYDPVADAKALVSRLPR